MNVGRKIQMPQAIDPAGNPLPIGASFPQEATPPPPEGTLDRVARGIGKFGERIGPIARDLTQPPPVLAARALLRDLPGGGDLSEEQVGRMADQLGLSAENKRRYMMLHGFGADAEVSSPTVTRPEVVPPEDREAPIGGAPARAPAGGAVGASGPAVARGGPALPSMLKESEMTTTHRGIPVSDDVRARAEQAYYAKRAAAEQETEARRAEAQAAGRFAAEQAEATNAFMAHDDRIKREQSQELTDQRRKLEQDVQAVREGQIDPNRYWNNLSTGSKIAGVLGIALAEGVAARNGGRNNVADRVMHMIDADIGAQRDNLDLRAKAAAGQHNLISATRQQYQDEAQARLASRAMGIEAARQRLAATLSGVEDQRALAEGAAIDADLQSKYAETLQKFDEVSADKVIVQSQEVSTFGGKYGRGAGGAGGTGGPGDGLTKQEQTDTNDLSKELVKSKIPETKADLERLKGAIPEKGEIPGIGGIHRVTSILGGTAEALDNKLYNLFGPREGQEVRQAAAVLFNRQLKDESGAAVSDQELDRQKQAFYGARDAQSARAALAAYEKRLSYLEATIRSGHSDRVNAAQQSREAQRAGGRVTPLPGGR